MPSIILRQIERARLQKASRKMSHCLDRVSHCALRNNRQHCIEALQRHVAVRGTNAFFDKAMILLTQYWAKTPWRGRAELVRTAD